MTTKTDRYLRLGRLYLPTALSDFAESVGDQLDTVGSGIVPGERRSRPLTLHIPLHGSPQDSDPYAQSERTRRQVRSLMENTRAKVLGVYLQFAPDVEMNSWLLIGAGDLQYAPGGISLSEFSLQLQDCFKIASKRTHRYARRVELYDRRLGTTARDVLGLWFGTDWASVAALPLIFLPVGASDVTGSARRVITFGTRTSMGGAIPVIALPVSPSATANHGEVVSFEVSDLSMHQNDDVIIYDRRNNPTQASGYRSTVLADLPTGYWSLGETQGTTTVTDASPNNLAGTYIGVPQLGVVAGISDPDTAAGLSEDDGIYAKVPNSSPLRITGDMTIEGWLRPIENAIPNLVENHDFEVDLMPWTGAALSGNTTTPSLTRSAAWFQSGSASLLASATSTAPTLTVSGNEITDATRTAAASLTTGSSGQMADGLLNDSSFGIHRAATNLFRRGQCDATTDWTTASGGVTTRATDATTAPPFSTQSMKYTTDGAAANQGALANSGTGLALAAGVSCVGSVYFKGVSGSSYSFRLRVVNTDATTTFGGITNITATGAWQLATPAAMLVAVGKTGDTLVVETFINGTRAESFWVAHAMLESGQTVVAPYVATSGGATATHAAARVQAPASLLNATQGWVAMRVRVGWASSGPVPGTNPCFFFWGDSANARLQASFSSGTLQVFRQTGGVGANASQTWTFTAGTISTIVFAWTATQIKASVNGAAFTAVANTNIPVLSATLAAIGDDNGGVLSGAVRVIDSEVLWFACGSGALTDADAATINSIGNTDPSASQFPSTSTMTGVWPASTSAYDTGLGLAGFYVESSPRNSSSAIPVKPSTSYAIQATVNATATPRDGIAAEIVWLDSAGVVISTNLQTPADIATGVATISITATSPPTAVYAVVGARALMSAGQTASFHLDNVAMVEGTTVPATTLRPRIDTIVSKWESTNGYRSYRFGYDAYLNELRLEMSSDGTARAIATTTGGGLMAGTWSYVAVVYIASTGTASFYRNGVQVPSSGSLPTSIFSAPTTLTIAKWEADQS